MTEKVIHTLPENWDSESKYVIASGRTVEGGGDIWLYEVFLESRADYLEFMGKMHEAAIAAGWEEKELAESLAEQECICTEAQQTGEDPTLCLPCSVRQDLQLLEDNRHALNHALRMGWMR